MEAIILAGGLGTRLRPAVPDLPKPLAPVAGRPFLAIVLDSLSRQDIETVVLSVGYRHECIRAEFGDTYSGLALRYAIEAKPLGTGGAIRLAAAQCVGPEVFVVNGDSYVALDYCAMLSAHLATGSRLSVCIAEVPDASRYGSVVLEDGRIVRFLERGAKGPGRINAGVYLIRRDLLDGMALPEAFSFERDVLAEHAAELKPLAFKASGTFIDIGVPADYAKAQNLFAIE
jgi:D-glycero-alpha-D-manno-heptose 1-phosphate guanylyltransferase